MHDPAALFRSLSDAVRLRLLRLLAQEELNVQELVAITGLSQPRVSKHLGLLRKQGWVRQRKEGTWSWYRTCAPADVPGAEQLLAQVLPAADLLPEAAGDDRHLAQALDRRQLRTRKFFADMADRWDAIRRHYKHPDLDVGMMGALVSPGTRVLDVGAGSGGMLPELAATGARVLALDLSLPMLERARARCRAAAGINFCCGTAEALPLPDGAFHAVHCAMVLHHVARPGLVIRELARVLRPAGRLALTSFCAHHQEWMRAELAHQWLGFARQEMEQFFRDAGLRPVRRLQRGPRPADGSGHGGGFDADHWPDIFLMTGVKDADHGG